MQNQSADQQQTFGGRGMNSQQHQQNHNLQNNSSPADTSFTQTFSSLAVLTVSLKQQQKQMDMSGDSPVDGMQYNSGQYFGAQDPVEALKGNNVVNTQAYQDLSQDQQEQILKQLEQFGNKQIRMLSNSNSSKFIQILNNFNINININNSNESSNSAGVNQNTRVTEQQPNNFGSQQDLKNKSPHEQNMAAQSSFVNQSLNAGLTINQTQLKQMASKQKQTSQKKQHDGTQQIPQNIQDPQSFHSSHGGSQQHPDSQGHLNPKLQQTLNTMTTMTSHLKPQANSSSLAGSKIQVVVDPASEKQQTRISIGSKGQGTGPTAQGSGTESQKISSAVYGSQSVAHVQGSASRAARAALGGADSSDARLAQQSQESFLPYEENGNVIAMGGRVKRGNGRDGHGGHSLAISHPSSGKSNTDQKPNLSTVNTSQKIHGGEIAVKTSGWEADKKEMKNIKANNINANMMQQHVVATNQIDSAAGLHTQGSVSGGLQFKNNGTSNNYPNMNSGQHIGPFRRKGSNTNKNSLTQLNNNSLQHEEETGPLEELSSSMAPNRQRIHGFNQLGVSDMKENAGTSSNQGTNYQSNLGLRMNSETAHPQYNQGVSLNHSKGGGGTFVAAKGLASVNRVGNKYINSKNANVPKVQFAGHAGTHQMPNQSSSLGRDQLKSAGGIINFEQSVVSGSQNQQQLILGNNINLISQNPNLNNQNTQNFDPNSNIRQPFGNVTGNSHKNTLKYNEVRDRSKQKHNEDTNGAHGSSQPRAFDSLEDDHPYLPYQNQTVKLAGSGTNSSSINSRIASNQLQSSLQLNSGIGSLACGNGYIPGRNQALNINNRQGRDNSGTSQNMQACKSIVQHHGDDLNGSDNSNMNMNLMQDHPAGIGQGVPYYFNKSGIHIQPDYNNSNKGSLSSFKAASYTRKMSPDKSIPVISKQSQHQQYSFNNKPSNGKQQIISNYGTQGQISQTGSRETSMNAHNMSPPRQFELMKNNPKNKFDSRSKNCIATNQMDVFQQHQGPIPIDGHFVNQSQSFQNSATKDNGRIINRSLNKGGIKQDRKQERNKNENGSQISSTSNINKGLSFGIPQRQVGLNQKNNGTDSITLNNLNRGGTNHNKHRNGLIQMNEFEKRNPVCNDEDEHYDDAVYENDEFETVDNDATNMGANLGQQHITHLNQQQKNQQQHGQDSQTRGNSGTQRCANNQFIGNNTFYAGQQNTKFFDKRILASQKQNRPKNTFGPQVQNEIDQSSQGHSGYSPHIKQQKQSKKNQNLQRNQRAVGQSGVGAVLPNVNESHVLPSLSRTGNNMNQNSGGGSNNRMGGVGSVHGGGVASVTDAGGNGQRVASRRTSTRQKAEIQGTRIIQSRQRQEAYISNNENPSNVYTMNTEKNSPDQSHSKINFTNYNHSQPRNQTQGQLIHPGSISRGGVSNKNSYKIKELPLNMENEPRENMNLAQYNFNRMDVIYEEGEANHGHRGGGAARRSTRGVNDQLMSAGQDRRGSKNMHNTTTNFYPQRFGDRLPTRGDVQSRGRQNLIPSAQGTRQSNNRADNSFGRGQQHIQMQINPSLQQQPPNKSGTHYGSMYQETTHKSLIGMPGAMGLGLTSQPSTTANNNTSIRGDNDGPNCTNQQQHQYTDGRNAGIGINSKSIPLQVQNKQRIRMSTESVNSNVIGASGAFVGGGTIQAGVHSVKQPHNQVSMYQGNKLCSKIQKVQSNSKNITTQDNQDQGAGCFARRNSQLNDNEFDGGSIGRISGPLAGIAEQAEPGGGFYQFSEPPTNYGLALNNFTTSANDKNNRQITNFFSHKK